MRRGVLKFKRGMLETAAKKITIVKSGDKVMVPDLDRTKIDAHILRTVIAEEFSNVQFKLGTMYFLTLAGNKRNAPFCTGTACCPEPSPDTYSEGIFWKNPKP